MASVVRTGATLTEVAVPKELLIRDTGKLCQTRLSEGPGDVAHAFSVLCRAFEPDISESIVNSSLGPSTRGKPIAVDKRIRCGWAGTPSLQAYHDKEWGVPLHDDQKLFESLVLDGFQAGLSWAIVLQKREAFRKAFDSFEIKKVARYRDSKVERLLANPGIIRNRLKIRAAIENAKAALAVQREVGSLDAYLWKFVEGRTIQNSWKAWKEIPAHTKMSDAMSEDLKKRGFKFVGTTICYAFMQGVGMVNDHEVGCFRYIQLAKGASRRGR